jgi:hypothetical protein
VLVLGSQASLTQWLEGDGLALVPVGEGHMDTPTAVGELVEVAAGDVDSAGAGQYLTRTLGSDP